MNYFYLADKDRSNSLSKKECRRLLADSFNVKMPEAVFEQLFQVMISELNPRNSRETFLGC